jgi:hypothetical protein
MYDYYRINYVKILLIPRWSGTDMSYDGGAGNQNVSAPILMSIVDTDGGVPPTTEDGFLQYPGCKITRGAKTHTITLRPCVQQDIAGGNTTKSKTRTWLDMSAPSTVHQGATVFNPVLTMQDGSTPTASMSLHYEVILEMSFSCKGLR